MPEGLGGRVDAGLLEGVRDGCRGGVGDGFGVVRGVLLGVGAGDDGGRLVEDDNASAPLWLSRALAEMGTARGGSYAVPAITVCTPTTTA